MEQKRINSGSKTIRVISYGTGLVQGAEAGKMGAVITESLYIDLKQAFLFKKKNKKKSRL